MVYRPFQYIKIQLEREVRGQRQGKVDDMLVQSNVMHIIFYFRGKKAKTEKHRKVQHPFRINISGNM